MIFEQSDKYNEIRDFAFPKYNEITDIGLYLEQVCKIVEKSLEPLFGTNDTEKWLTPAMISNYVKQGVIEKPENKKYDRDRIAYLIFVCTCKMVLSLSDLKRFIGVQKSVENLELSYNFFCEEFETVLKHVFSEKYGNGENFEDIKSKKNEAKIIRAISYSVAHKIYLKKYVEFLKEQEK